MREEIIIEDFLKNHNFDLETYYGPNKNYRKEITDCQTLYVRIETNVNKILDVTYEHKPLTNFERDGSVSFETINTVEQLEYLIKAL